MAIKLQLQQMVEEQAGLFTAYINIVDDADGRIVRKFCVQGKTELEIKNAARPYLEKYKDEDAKKAVMKSKTTQALVSLESEVL